ncbi:MAG: hypothetical protein JNK29_06885, partial [Anaerolineales bacterium]|nr:hypothetical protein [Anaerolineales bacterium]
YTSSARQWGPEVERAYRWLNALLGPVKGQAVTARTVLQPGVTATTYANGRQIIVNYTDQPYAAGAVTVGARDARLQEVQP